MNTACKVTLNLFLRAHWYKSAGCLFLVLALPPLAAAEAISSVSCATPTGTLVSKASSCSSVGLYGYAEASVHSSVVLPATANQVAQIDLSSSVSALLGGVRGISAVSTAGSSNDIAIEFDTAAPLQAGFLELTFIQDQWSIPKGGLASEQLTIGSYTVSPNGRSITSLFIPIELGTDFSFNFLDSLIVNADSATGAITGHIGADISLQAFAADKTTPVLLFDPPAAASAPEPSLLGLMTIATFGALTLIIKNRISRLQNKPV